MIKKLPDLNTLKKLLDYDANTGILTFKERSIDMFPEGARQSNSQSRWNSRYAGKVTGSLRHDGYLDVHVLGKKYLAHRLAFVMHYGYEPKLVDHINGDKTDNRADNLREVDKRQNAQNSRLSRNNTSGCLGVYWGATNKKWIAQIQVDKVVYLGSYSNFYDAVLARKEANKLYGFHENHGVRK